MAKPRTKKKKPAAPADDGEETFPADPPAPKRPANRFGIAGNTVKGWKPAAEVLDTISSVSTCFLGFNRAIRCGGLPVRRIITIHGPTHGGKTLLVLGFLKSFAEADFLSGLVDAEHATGYEFVDEIMEDLRAFPNFVAYRPKNYEETIAKVDDFLDTGRKLRKEHEDFRSLLVVDSINKLVPKRELKKLLASGDDKRANEKAAEEMTKGHHGRYRAAVNQAWLDHLTPKLASAECSLVLIAQEREEEGDGFGDNFHVKGGAALLFDASIVARVMKSSPILINPSEKATNDNIAGFAHRVRVWKSKVGHMEGRHTDCFIYFSNGKLTPPGIDIARDAFFTAVDLGIIASKPKSSWYSWKPPTGAARRKNGSNAFIVYLANNSERLAELIAQVNTAIEKEAGRAA